MDLLIRPEGRAALRLALVLVAAGALGGCVRAPKWSVTPELVSQTLDDPSATFRDIQPEDVAEMPVRTHLRPCCAFGTQLQASLGAVPIPLFSIGNIVSVDELGPHQYDPPALSASGSSGKNGFAKENNGIVYTCRGGFIDTAHVRDYADWTLYWTATIARLSRTGGTVELPLEGGARRVVIRPMPKELLDSYGLRRTVVNVAQWVAFQLSIWHEIATAYGWSSLEMYPEYVSAFSPEDLYSNLLGTKIAGGLLMQVGSAATDALYDQNMDLWLRSTLDYLQPVSVDAGKSATYLVDGVWWDSKARLPDLRLVLHRNFDAGNEIVPWLVSRAYGSPEMQAWVERECAGSAQPLVLRRVDSLRGIAFSDLVTIEVDVDVPDAFPFPRAGSKRITQQDFPEVVAAARALLMQKLGPAADRPERAGP